MGGSRQRLFRGFLVDHQGEIGFAIERTALEQQRVECCFGIVGLQ